MQNLLTQCTPLISAQVLKVLIYMLTTVVWTMICGCGAPIPPSPTVVNNTQSNLNPILGPVTKGKILDRFKGYPICGMKGEEQKLTLQVQTFPLSQTKNSVRLIQVECFFFGVQGLYEFALINPKDGRIYPLAFQGAEPVKKSLKGAERQSPVALNKGRSEVCGVPDFDPKTQRLTVTCKGDPSGGCGTYAIYQLSQRDGGKFNPKTTYFKVNESRFHSCAKTMIPDTSRWSNISP